MCSGGGYACYLSMSAWLFGCFFVHSRNKLMGGKQKRGEIKWKTSLTADGHQSWRTLWMSTSAGDLPLSLRRVSDPSQDWTSIVVVHRLFRFYWLSYIFLGSSIFFSHGKKLLINSFWCPAMVKRMESINTFEQMFDMLSSKTFKQEYKFLHLFHSLITSNWFLWWSGHNSTDQWPAF